VANGGRASWRQKRTLSAIALGREAYSTLSMMRGARLANHLWPAAVSGNGMISVTSYTRAWKVRERIDGGRSDVLIGYCARERVGARSASACFGRLHWLRKYNPDSAGRGQAARGSAKLSAHFGAEKVKAGWCTIPRRWRELVQSG
jgi:hypothetical protein